jgi:thiol-disulfide isomerase/thioredoxin
MRIPSARYRIWIYLALGSLAAFALDGLHERHEQIGTLAPEIFAQEWVNADPVELSSLRGKVVLIKFWTFGCSNCTNVEPYVKSWHRKYADRGLVVIGVHTPEFDFERDRANVRRYVAEHDIRYRVAIDDTFTTWDRYASLGWPTLYLIDKQGIIRHVRIGEGGYSRMEATIQALLAESPNAAPTEAG